MGGEEGNMCFDCLESQIISDFSHKLSFNYATPDSPFPFAASAVVQMSSSDGDVAAPQFELVYLPRRRGDCLADYIDECCPDDCYADHKNGKDAALTVINQDQAKVSNGNLSDTPNSLQTESYESQCFSNGGINLTLPGLGCKSSTCYISGRFSCLRTITALAPVSQIGILSYSAFEELASSYLSGSVEEHILCSVSLLIEGKATGRDSINFLKLVGIPYFDDNSFPGCIRHPNIVPILGMMKSSSHISLVLPKAPYTLQNIIHYSPSALNSDWHIKFLIYQLLSALVEIHGLGVSHGNICPSNVLLTDSLWCWLDIGDKLKVSSNFDFNSRNEERFTTPPARIGCCNEDCRSSGIYADLTLSHSIDWHSAFDRWWRGELSNFEYLLVLNRLAGRRWGDYTFHTVMPWVIDFSVKPAAKKDTGWRDLSQSKWRLAKGDEQLDFTYSTSEIPHHVSDDCLSELAVCSYKARRLPVSVLRMTVRAVYEPNEYPSTMQRVYQWTPDECIPEFYCDPQIFNSRHSDMTDLAVPSWAGSTEEFIKLHRDALESDRVSSQIHHWIDITFGYKMSGQEAVVAKNVMLPPSEPRMPRSVGRRQLFSQPHPARHGVTSKARKSLSESAKRQCQVNKIQGENHLLCGTTHLKELEEAAAFREHALHLSPIYFWDPKDTVKGGSSLEDFRSESLAMNMSSAPEYARNSVLPSIIDLNFLLETIESDDDSPVGYQELFLWRQKSSSLSDLSEDIAKDIFSVGCILAELHLRRPLFDPTSLSLYSESGILPKLMKELPPQVEVLVEACIQKDVKRKPSAKCLLESPYFPATIRSSYLFLAPLQLLSKDGARLRYAASFVKHGVLKDMGKFASEMCAPYCLPLLVTPLSDTEAEWAYLILREFLKCLTLEAIKTLVLPAIQKILQATGYSHMKVSLLQGSFVQELWSSIGKQEYLEKVHPMVLSNLYVAPHKTSAGAASVLLIGSSEELGVPITVHQTILPLIHRFGRGLCNEGIDVVVRIGGLFGEDFIVKQIVPLLRNVVQSCIGFSFVNKPEPVQSWNALALIDCLMTLDGVIAVLPKEVIVKELIEDGSCLHVQVLMQANLGIPVLQAAATSLVAVSQQIGPDLTALHVMPKLKELFDELAFSQKTHTTGSLGGSLKVPKTKVEFDQIENRVDLVLLLYPPLASLLGIETLRQCCSTWLLLEQFLLRYHNWKCEYTAEASHGDPENINSKTSSFTEQSSAQKLLNGFGWSVPQPQGNKGSKNMMPQKRLYDHQQTPAQRHVPSSYFGKQEPWHWFPSPASSWDGPDFLRRVGGSNSEIPWKINASVIQSVRAHHGALRSFAVCPNECTVYTAGIGAGFKGTVLKWDLARINSLSGYYGHEEVVNDICVLASSDRTASCDGTVHVWNNQTGKLISVFAEFSENSAHVANPLASMSRINSDQANMLNFNPLSNGILSTAFDGTLYTSMHHLESVHTLVVGTGNGSLRFIDVIQGQKRHLWRTESVESNFPCMISSICSSSSDKLQADGAVASPSWIAAGLSSGKCRLLDMRSGNIIASWQAHDGYVTKLAAPEDHLLVSSSLDKTLRVWDLRRSWTSEPVVFGGHSDSVSGFSVWGQNVISISRNKIGLSSLSRLANDDGPHRISPQYLHTADRDSRNMSILSSITILPFSRLFLVGTEDGYLKICS